MFHRTILLSTLEGYMRKIHTLETILNAGFSGAKQVSYVTSHSNLRVFVHVGVVCDKCVGEKLSHKLIGFESHFELKFASSLLCSLL